MPTRPNANKISSKTQKWLSACVYGNLSLLLPQEPCSLSPKSFPYDDETRWMPLAMGRGLSWGLWWRPSSSAPSGGRW
jgi:hypothetical protein